MPLGCGATLSYKNSAMQIHLHLQGYMPAAAPPAPVCTSCGDQLTRAEAQYASAQAGRCASCQQLHQAGSYCRVCDKVRQPIIHC